jgi:hypothetical protein
LAKRTAFGIASQTAFLDSPGHFFTAFTTVQFQDITGSKTLCEVNKTATLETLEFIDEQMVQPSEKRQKAGVITPSYPLAAQRLRRRCGSSGVPDGLRRTLSPTSVVVRKN